MADVLAHLRWPSLAQDLAVLSAPGAPVNLSGVCSTYGLTEKELKHLLTVPEFVEIYARELNGVQAQGDRAGPLYRFRSLSQSLAEKLFRDAFSDDMDAKDAIKLLELLLKAAALMDHKDTQVNTQVNVGISLPLPTGLNNSKLKHLEAGV